MEDIVYLINRLIIVVKGASMTELEMEIIERIWDGLSYKQIADICYRKYPTVTSEKYISNTGATLLQLVNQGLKQIPINESVKKSNFRPVISLRRKEIILGLKELEKRKKNSLEFASKSRIAKNVVKKNKIKQLEHPDAPVPLNSDFYIERKEEIKAYKIIQSPGSVIRIIGKRGIGATSLVSRLRYYAQNSLDNYVVIINFQGIDTQFLSSKKSFMQWFCSYISDELEIEERLDEYWRERSGPNTSSRRYFEQYLLPLLSKPAIIVLDRIDYIFDKKYEQIATDFFALIRSWIDRRTDLPDWNKLKYIIVQGEKKIEMGSKRSPFNIGAELRLSFFNTSEIIELAKRHTINWSETEVQKLTSIFGDNIGHPHLLRHILYRIVQDNLNLEQFCELDFKTIKVFEKYLN